MDFLAGKKTYVVGAAMVLYGLSGLVLGHIDYNEAARIIGEGLGFVFLRKGIESK